MAILSLFAAELLVLIAALQHAFFHNALYVAWPVEAGRSYFPLLRAPSALRRSPSESTLRSPKPRITSPSCRPAAAADVGIELCT